MAETPDNPSHRLRRERRRRRLALSAAGGVLLLIAVAAALWATGRPVWQLPDDRAVPAGQLRPRQVAWSPPEPLAIADLPAERIRSAAVTPDGGQLILAFDDPADGGELLACRRIGPGWGPPTRIASADWPARQRTPSISPVGRWLLLSGDAAGPREDADLYISRPTADGWTVPLPVRGGVNTPADEHSPAVSADGRWLVFARTRAEQDDLYIARRLDGTDPNRPAFGDARPLHKLNTPAGERGPCFSPDGGVLYFASDRPAGPGGWDIYRTRIDPQGRPDDPAPLEATLNTPGDEQAPACWAGGLALVVRTDHGEHPLAVSRSREVFAARRARPMPTLGPAWWALLVGLALLAPLLVYLKAVGYRHLDLIHKCIVVSVLVHVLLTVLLSAMFVSRDILEYVADEAGMTTAVNLEVAREVQVKMDLRSQRVALPVADPSVTELVESESTSPPADIAPSSVELQPAPASPAPAQPTTPHPTRRNHRPRPIQRAVSRDVPHRPDLAVARPDRPRLTEPDQPSAELDRPEPPTLQASPSPPRPQTVARTTPAPETPPVESRITPLQAPPAKVRRDLPAPPPPGEPGTVAVAVLDLAPRPDASPLADRRPTEPPAPAEPLPPAPRVDRVDPNDAPPEPVELADDDAPLTPQALAPDAVAASTRRPPRPRAPRPPRRDTPTAPRLSAVPARTTPADDAPTVPEPEPQVPSSQPPVLAARSVAPDTPRAIGPRVDRLRPARREALAISAAEVRRPNPSPPARSAPPAIPAAAGAVEPGRLTSPEALAHRSYEQRQRLVEAMGGSRESEAAVARALAFLARCQRDDGHWTKQDDRDPSMRSRGNDHNMALTGLSLLCFLAADHTPARQGPYQQVTARGLDYLIARQRKNGDLRGKGDMYDHGIAALALNEAAVMTRDGRYRSAAARALAFIRDAQSRRDGGWRYRPGQEGDTSVVGWQVMALHGGRAIGVSLPDRVGKNALRFLASVTHKDGVRAGYQKRNRPTPPMTAEAALSRILLGDRPSDDQARRLSAYLLDNPPDKGKRNYYYAYYATLAMWQLQGKDWERWNQRMKSHLLKTQHTGGWSDGSWPSRKSRWGDRGGIVYSTAMATLTLEVYYRYLPVYARPADEE